MKNTILFAAAAGATAVGYSSPADSRQRNHDFSSVSVCRDDYSEVDFCDRRHVGEVRKALATKRAEFNHQYIVVTFAESPARTSYAVVDARNGRVYPLPFDYFGPFVDSRGAPVASPRSSVGYRLDSDVICFTGSTYDYRNVLENQKSCFKMKLPGFEPL